VVKGTNQKASEEFRGLQQQLLSKASSQELKMALQANLSQFLKTVSWN